MKVAEVQNEIREMFQSQLKENGFIQKCDRYYRGRESKSFLTVIAEFKSSNEYVYYRIPYGVEAIHIIFKKEDEEIAIKFADAALKQANMFWSGNCGKPEYLEICNIQREIREMMSLRYGN